MVEEAGPLAVMCSGASRPVSMVDVTKLPSAIEDEQTAAGGSVAAGPQWDEVVIDPAKRTKVRRRAKGAR